MLSDDRPLPHKKSVEKRALPHIGLTHYYGAHTLFEHPAQKSRLQQRTQPFSRLAESKTHTRPVDILNVLILSLIHISEPTRRTPISYAVFCLKKKKNKNNI